MGFPYTRTLVLFLISIVQFNNYSLFHHGHQLGFEGTVSSLFTMGFDGSLIVAEPPPIGGGTAVGGPPPAGSSVSVENAGNETVGNCPSSLFSGNSGMVTIGP